MSALCQLRTLHAYSITLSARATTEADGEAERLRSLEVDIQFKLGGLLYRQFTGFMPFNILSTYPAARRKSSASLGP